MNKISPGPNFKATTDGCTIVVIGARGTGKSYLVNDILYNKSKIVPTAMVFSGTEDTNHHYAKIIPDTFIYNGLDLDRIDDKIKRQKYARKYLENPFSVMILDDVTDDPKILKKPLFQKIFKEGRHWNLVFMLILQYGLDIIPQIRKNIDFTFILREPLPVERKKLFENYAGIIGDYALFCDLMDSLTEDYTALVIHGTAKTNNWQECVFWYKAKPTPSHFKFGCPEIWDFHHARHNPDYNDLDEF